MCVTMFSASLLSTSNAPRVPCSLQYLHRLHSHCLSKYYSYLRLTISRHSRKFFTYNSSKAQSCVYFIFFSKSLLTHKKAFSAYTEMIICFLLFNLLMWFMNKLIDLWLFKDLWIPGINST